MIRIISKIKFMIENNLWFFSMIKILDLAIIISAATKILSRMSVDDIVSIEETDDSVISIWLRNNMLIAPTKVKINNEAIVVHQ